MAQKQVVIAVMGATGTGKSTFIHLLTNDDTIRVGHNQDSETSSIQTANYIDQATGHHVTLIDTPGFDDSREGITDTDILQQIVDYLEPESGESRKLNGLIYMHRISDPRVGGVSRKNLRMFHSLCGDKTLANVRIVTTNWSRVTEEEGNHREADLTTGAFKLLVDAGARVHRHADTVESALHIMSELIPLEAVTTAIQEEVQAGMTLAATGAGQVLTGDMKELQMRHEQEMAELKRDMEIAAKKRNEALRAEFGLKLNVLEEKLKRMAVDRVKLEKTLEEHREEKRKARAAEKAELVRLENQWADERRMLLAEIAATRETVKRLENDAANRQESERQIAHAKKQWASERSKILAELTVAHENATQLASSLCVLIERLTRGTRPHRTDPVILVMGADDTGKSTFINLLTGDDTSTGHNKESETCGVHAAQYIDQATGCSVMVIDSPGFDDSREGITDIDILGKIVRFLEPESGQRVNLNGIIYMHRISDSRIGGTSRRNLKMFSSLCGEKNLANVRIVTTNWSRVTEEEGNYREADLKSGVFESLIEAGARMRRHANTVDSAHQIMSELIPLPSMTMEIQEEMHAGKKLVDTSAGQALVAEAQEMKRKHEQELADLEREVEEAEEEENRALLVELELERKDLVEKMEHADADRLKLQVTLDMMHAGSGRERGESEASAKVRENEEDTSEPSKTTLERNSVELDAIGAKAQRSRSSRTHMQPRWGGYSGTPKRTRETRPALRDIDQETARMEIAMKALQAKIHDEEMRPW